MTIFESDGESLKSIQILFVSFILAILYLVWKSTQVREIEISSSIQLPAANYGEKIIKITTTNDELI